MPLLRRIYILGEGVVGFMPLFSCIYFFGEGVGFMPLFRCIYFFWRGGGLYASF